MAVSIASLNSAFVTVGVASTMFSTVIGGNEIWQFCSSTACFIAQGEAPAAAAAAGSVFVPAGVPILIHGNDGAKLAVIQQAAGGSATLSRVNFV